MSTHFRIFDTSKGEIAPVPMFDAAKPVCVMIYTPKPQYFSDVACKVLGRYKSRKAALAAIRQYKAKNTPLKKEGVE